MSTRKATSKKKLKHYQVTVECPTWATVIIEATEDATDEVLEKLAFDAAANNNDWDTGRYELCSSFEEVE